MPVGNAAERSKRITVFHRTRWMATRRVVKTQTLSKFKLQTSCYQLILPYFVQYLFLLCNVCKLHFIYN